MRRLFDPYVKDILDAANPRSILEIGAASGTNTLELLRWCRAAGARLTTVDPVAWKGDLPEDVRIGADGYRFKRQGGCGEDYGDEAAAIDAGPLEVAYREGLFEHWTCEKTRSVPFLDQTKEGFDIVLLDGEHSYYAVSRELPRIAEKLNSGGLVLLHDVIGKHSRKDFFYDIEGVPEEFRKMKPGGVVTAVEDFLEAEGGVKKGALCAIERYHFDLGQALQDLPSLRGKVGRLRRLPKIARSGWDEIRADLIFEKLAGGYDAGSPGPEPGQWVFEIVAGRDGGLGVLRQQPCNVDS